MEWNEYTSDPLGESVWSISKRGLLYQMVYFVKPKDLQLQKLMASLVRKIQIHAFFFKGRNHIPYNYLCHIPHPLLLMIGKVHCYEFLMLLHSSYTYNLFTKLIALLIMEIHGELEP